MGFLDRAIRQGVSDLPEIYFANDEPSGGFDYVKPEPKKNDFLGGLFK